MKYLHESDDNIQDSWIFVSNASKFYSLIPNFLLPQRLQDKSAKCFENFLREEYRNVYEGSLTLAVPFMVFMLKVVCWPYTFMEAGVYKGS